MKLNAPAGQLQPENHLCAKILGLYHWVQLAALSETVLPLEDTVIFFVLTVSSLGIIGDSRPCE